MRNLNELIQDLDNLEVSLNKDRLLLIDLENDFTFCFNPNAVDEFFDHLTRVLTYDSGEEKEVWLYDSENLPLGYANGNKKDIYYLTDFLKSEYRASF